MAFYSVIKYVPNPANDESINVGVLVFEGNQVEARFVPDLGRARAFSRKDPAALRSVLSDFQQMLHEGTLNEARIRRMCESWHSQVQVSMPRVSTQGTENLLEEVSALFLPDESPAAGVRRPGKRRAVKLAVESLTQRITTRFHTSKAAARRLIKLDYEVPGRLESHELDLALVNGALKVGAIAMSFALENRSQLKRDMDAAAFAIEDLRRSNRGLPLYVLGHAADAGRDDVRRATTLFQNWNAQVVTDSRIDTWSRAVVGSLPEDVIHS